MTAPKSITDGLLAMKAEHALLLARADALDRAINTVSHVYGLNGHATAEVQRPKAERRQRARGGSESDDTQTTLILSALRHTVRPVSVGELLKETKLSAYLLNDRLAKLSAKKLVVITGKTAAKRISLPGISPAKEAP